MTTKERAILFTGPMVRLILGDSKTQTRRLVKPQPDKGWAFEDPPVLGRITSPHQKKGRFGAFILHGVGTSLPLADLIPCPYGQPGDRLWVKEAHWWFKDVPNHETGYYPKTPTANDVSYRADEDDENKVWRPSIFMPRWASRITLEITNVRVERLWDISEEDCIAEGCSGGHGLIPCHQYNASPREQYFSLWEQINGGGSWDANPWVWVIKFKKKATHE